MAVNAPRQVVQEIGEARRGRRSFVGGAAFVSGP
jgi:hypothetical protein